MDIAKSDQNEIFKFSARATLLLLILIGIILRFYKMPERGLWFDEMETWYSAMSGGIRSLDSPFVGLLYRAFMAMLGLNNDFAMHLLPVFLGIISTIVVWAWVRTNELFQNKYVLQILLVSGVALSPFHIYYSLEARPYAILLLLSLLTFVTFVKFYQVRKKRNFMLFLFFIVATMASHGTGLAVVSGYAAYFLWETLSNAGKSRSMKENLICLAMTTLFAALGAYWLIMPVHGTVAPSSIPSGIYSLGFAHFMQTSGLILGGLMIYPKDLLPTIFLAVAFWTIVGFASYDLWRRRLFFILIPCITTILITMAILYLTLGTEMSHWSWARYLSPAFVPFCYLLAYGFFVLSKASKILLWLAPGSYIFILLMGDYNYVGKLAIDYSESIKEVVETVHLNAQTARGVIFRGKHMGYRRISQYFLYRKDSLPLYHSTQNGKVTAVNYSQSIWGNFTYPVIGEPVESLAFGNYIVIFDDKLKCDQVLVGDSRPFVARRLIGKTDRFGIGECELLDVSAKD